MSARRLPQEDDGVQMIIDVTEAGVLIPRDLLPHGIAAVEIRRENGLIIIAPVRDERDPFEMGSKAETCGLSDASANHDRYLYRSTEEK
jgi:virulence-associated protein VagC